MEDSKETSQHLYEDEHVILTPDNELFLKQDWQSERKKLCEVSEDEVEEKVANLREVFQQIQQKVEEILDGDEITEEMLKELEQEIKNSDGVGNISKLKAMIEEKKSDLDEDAPSNEVEDEAGAVEDQAEEAETEVQDEEKEQLDDDAEEVEAQEEPEEDDSEEKAKAQEEDTTEEVEASDEEDEDPLAYYRDILDKAKELAKQSDWSYVSVELDNL
ncbi:MAG: hypothetical protein ACQEST_11740, partial [Bacteroidota bacterium]